MIIKVKTGEERNDVFVSAAVTEQSILRGIMPSVTSYDTGSNVNVIVPCEGGFIAGSDEGSVDLYLR